MKSNRIVVPFILAILMALLFEFASVLAQSPQTRSGNKIDYQAEAKGAEWRWQENLRGPFWGTGRYSLRITLQPNGPLTFSIVDGVTELYSWKGNFDTVYQVLDDKLYYVDSDYVHGYGVVTAVDLTNGKILWRSPLLEILAGGLGTRNGGLGQFRIDVQPPVIYIYGWAPNGRYYEIKDVNSGETLGRKNFAPATTQLGS